MKKIGLYLCLLFTLISCGNDSKKERLNHEYKFRSTIFSPNNCVPVICLKSGEDNNCNFIIDTGSEVNVLNESYYNRHQNEYVVIDSLEHTINTLNGNSHEKSYIVRGMLNDSIPTDFYVMDIDITTEIIFVNQRIKIEGILGVDFMYDNNIIIDFKNKTITNHNKTL